jgi:predicted lysophospholipase L1 biosynthesis ABC-type transport system permease subunit
MLLQLPPKLVGSFVLMYGRTWNRIELLHRFVCVVALVVILVGAASVAVLFIIQSQTSTSEFASLLSLHLRKRPRRSTCCGFCHYVGHVCVTVFAFCLGIVAAALRYSEAGEALLGNVLSPAQSPSPHLAPPPPKSQPCASPARRTRHDALLV